MFSGRVGGLEHRFGIVKRQDPNVNNAQDSIKE